MWEAKVPTVRFSVVRTRGSCDINDPNNVHRRNYSGIVREADDVITNPATKLIYFPRDAETVTSMVNAIYAIYAIYAIFKGRDLSRASKT
ncbi:hypothetical protein EOS_36000 [Caballeronia mineralivorans PML1(12)]|uniref:Uncharacterized protein n=1 Tax=Caballeronia mineralivorans PML1(12) TaxID=908627 RepID=A0A0J1CL48_9BURK|nr:hypothetical protein EOS_36000 [Caballeronia mineralivorans PML1(12)]